LPPLLPPLLPLPLPLPPLLLLLVVAHALNLASCALNLAS
jgi:hypothetical protein